MLQEKTTLDIIESYKETTNELREILSSEVRVIWEKLTDCGKRSWVWKSNDKKVKIKFDREYGIRVVLVNEKVVFETHEVIDLEIFGKEHCLYNCNGSRFEILTLAKNIREIECALVNNLKEQTEKNKIVIESLKE